MKAVRPIKGLWLRMREDGVGPTLKGLRDGVTPKLWYIYRFIEPTTGGETRVDIDSNLDRLARIRASHPALASEYFRDQARRADRCFFALIGEKLAGIVWVLDEQHPSRVIHLGRGEVELAFLYVETEFRGRGIARSLIQEACRVLPQQGVSTVFSIIEQHNTASQRAFLASGFQRVAALHRPLLFGRRYYSPAAASAHR
jgi:ribosomal protein S18 acetylase RimI-like enzyme